MNMLGRVILDLAGCELTSEECELLQHPETAGVILFSRNYDSIKQLKALTHAIRQSFPEAIIAVDQEGGRVTRFREGFSIFGPMCEWGERYQHNPTTAKEALANSIRILCTELVEAGISLNLIPVLDVNHGVSEIIGERSLHQDPSIIIELATIVIQSLHQCGMPAVGKHFPGHGGVSADSHLTLPVDNRDWAQLIEADLQPFKQLAPQLDMIMPAHIIFDQCDDKLTTFSRFWLKQVLREQLNFSGVTISDDLTMSAVESVGDYPTRATLALEAGIDLLLVCNQRSGAISVLEHLEGETANQAQLQRLQQLRQHYGWT